jgi:site-specific recombinase XerD
MTPIAPLIEAFLDETLARQRAVSRHTRDSYAVSFQLLFMFAAKRLKVSPSALTLEQLDADLISAFLEYLEDKRKNAPVTRNVRLAAIKSFFRFLEYRQPAALEHIRRVLAIPFKKRISVWSLIFCGRSCKRCSTLRIPPPAMASATGPCCIWRFAQVCACPSWPP